MLVLLAVVGGTGWWLWGSGAAIPPEGPRPAFARGVLTIRQTNGQQHDFNIEIAESLAEQAYGLMYIREMAPDAGMLFLSSQDKDQQFWMKNTYIPLDMLFIAGDGRIINIVAMTQPLSLKSVRSLGPARATLEIRGGRAAELDIRPGDKVIYPGLGVP